MTRWKSTENIFKMKELFLFYVWKKAIKIPILFFFQVGIFHRVKKVGFFLKGARNIPPISFLRGRRRPFFISPSCFEFRKWWRNLNILSSTDFPHFFGGEGRIFWKNKKYSRIYPQCIRISKPVKIPYFPVHCILRKKYCIVFSHMYCTYVRVRITCYV